MQRDPRAASQLLQAFAARTGLEGTAKPRRYLWTDAFAVCTWVGLGELSRARRLVDHVHRILGRHRPDDARTGWISGLPEEEGARHPTRGGLRIGKPLPERREDETWNARLEWERDGQYFHYLTRWMQALDVLALATDAPRPNLWARELAEAAHRGFTVGRPGARRMIWKASIDLSHPLVPSMGHHDPLDGLVTCARLRATARELGASAGPTLDAALDDFRAICAGRHWETDDPLGLGGLLGDALRVAQLVPAGELEEALLEDLLDAARLGLRRYASSGALRATPEHRLAFRELGLAIGLAALEPMRALVQGPGFTRREALFRRLDALDALAHMGDDILATWGGSGHRAVATYTDHRDINDVMLATALAPGGVLLREPART